MGGRSLEGAAVKKRIAWLFPGQGAQYPGMGKDFAQNFPIARQTFEEAEDLLGENLSRIAFEGPEAVLTQTQNSQLALFVTSIAISRVLLQQLPHLEPTFCSGLSLGEYTALAASKRLGFRETLLLVKERGRLMSEACEKRAGSMAAVFGLNASDLEASCKKKEEVWIANYNCPGQIVISGTKKGIEKAIDLLKAKGAKRIVPLAVHGAFHSGLMESASQGLAPAIAAAPIQKSAIGFVMNVPGDFVEDPSAVQCNLTAQVTHPVRWEQGIAALEAKEVELYLEIGAGSVLTGMNKKIGVRAPTFSLERIADLEKVAKWNS